MVKVRCDPTELRGTPKKSRHLRGRRKSGGRRKKAHVAGTSGSLVGGTGPAILALGVRKLEDPHR